MRLALLTLTCCCSTAFAHDLDVSMRIVPPTVVLKATYAGADPVPFAKVQVFSPAGAEFQNANTDKNGAFSFVPDAAGSWRVSIDDELGHRRETVVDIASLDASDARQQVPASRFERALLGLALIFGATGLWYGYRNRSQS